MKHLFNNLVLLVMLVLTSCAQAQTGKEVPNLEAKEVKQLLDSGKEVVILDVRRPDEFEQGHLKGAANINYQAEDFEQQITQLDTTKTYMLYCATGNRSGKAGQLMAEKNFTHVYNGGGFKDLQAEGLPTE
jgi:phage shock protein E